VILPCDPDFLCRDRRPDTQRENPGQENAFHTTYNGRLTTFEQCSKPLLQTFMSEEVRSVGSLNRRH
jgi:hypothetical protein